MIGKSVFRFCGMAMLAVLAATASLAQNRGPFAAHQGLEVTTAFESGFGPDAESTTVMAGVDPEGVDLSYTSSRGVVSQRRVLRGDMMAAPTFVLGYANKMPRVIPGLDRHGAIYRGAGAIALHRQRAVLADL